jgi:hypothetical protein
MLIATNRIADATENIANALRGLPDAATNAAKGITSAFSTITPPSFRAPWADWGNPPDYSFDQQQPIAEAEGGFGYASGPMTFSTKGNEFFAFSGEGSSFNSSAFGGNNTEIRVTIPVNLDGREITRVVVPLLPSELRRLGVAA